MRPLCSRWLRRRSSPSGAGSGAAVEMPQSPRSGRPARLRVLCAVPRRPEPARARHACRTLADRRRPRPAQAADQLHPHLFDRSRARQDSGDRAASRHESAARPVAVEPARISTAGRSTPTIELANKFPDVIEAVIVGNEVLLRGEMSAPELARTIREVKAKVPMRGHLCRGLGFLAAPSRRRRRGRFHHRAYPSLLGGSPDPGRPGGAPCRR